MKTKNIFNKNIKLISTRDGFGDGLLELGKTDKSVFVLCCDLNESTRIHLFAKSFPDRFIQVGVAEQNMIGLATGIALEGKTVFCSSYATFNPGRNWDQCRVSVCYNNANVKIIGSHSGISVGADGATHQALEDIASVRVLPNLTIIAPCDYNQTKKATIEVSKIKGPVYMRFARHNTPVFTSPNKKFQIGKSDILKKGSDITLIGYGPLLYDCLVVAKNLEKLKNKISVEVINSHTIKPFDEKTFLNSVKKTKAVVTVEEHQIIGGLAGVVSEVLALNNPTPVEFVGMPNCFGESGEPNELLQKYGMDQNSILKAIKKVLKRK